MAEFRTNPQFDEVVHALMELSLKPEPYYERSEKELLFEKDMKSFVDKNMYAVENICSTPLGICLQDDAHVKSELLENEQLRNLVAENRLAEPTEFMRVREEGDNNTYGVYNFRIKTFDDIDKALKSTWTAEYRSPVKMNIAFDYIIQNLDKAEGEEFSWADPGFTYEVAEAGMDDAYKNHPLVVSDFDNLALFQEYTKSKIASIHESLRCSGSAHKPFLLFGMMVVAYRLKTVGASAASPMLQPHIHNNFTYYIESKYDICLFTAIEACLVVEEGKTINNKIKHTLEADAKENVIKFFNPHITHRFTKKKFLEQLRIPATDDMFLRLANFYKRNIATYKQQHGLETDYTVDEKYKYEGGNENTKTVHVLMIKIENDALHALAVTQPDRVASVKLCPKCHVYAIDTKRMQYRLRLKKHIDECKGEKKGLRLCLSRSIPYIPHIQKNKAYAFLLARGMEHLFKRTEFFITYDFETMERQIIPDDKAGKNVRSHLLPLSIASTVHTKHGDFSIYYDRRDGADFARKWLRGLFKRAQEVAKDNGYEKIVVDGVEEDVPYNHLEVPVFGFNSSRFDANLLLPNLHTPDWTIPDRGVLGSLSAFKCLKAEERGVYTNIKKEPEIQMPDSVEELNDDPDDDEPADNDDDDIAVDDDEYLGDVDVEPAQKQFITLVFKDARNFVAGGTLESFVKDFGEGSGEEGKDVFPYEAVTADSYQEYLDSTEPFPQKDFDSFLKNTTMSDEDYAKYLSNWNRMVQDGVVINRWDYLKYYNVNDTAIMIKPIDNLSKKLFNDKVDMLVNFSLASNAVQVKYACAYVNFEIDGDYNIDNPPPYELRYDECVKMCARYVVQDKKAEREWKHNVSTKDFGVLKEMFKKPCYICKANFSVVNIPTLDRIDNDKSHTLDNVRPCCELCNKSKSNKDEYDIKLKIQLTKYCLKYNLPMTIEDERVHDLIKECSTGGLSNVLHRRNVAGETHINHFRLENGKVISKDSDHVMTHVTSIDFNSLYPSVMGSVYHEFIRYTNNQMLMPGRCIEYTKSVKRIRELLKSRTEIYFVKVKGHIPEELTNEYINFPPIIRNIDVKPEMIGKFMTTCMKENNKEFKGERKLTQLLSTYDKPMVFTSYYLWWLIDSCGFVVDEVYELALFTAGIPFKAFVEKFMAQGVKYMTEGNKGGEMYCKILMNSSYGFDGMNQESYPKNKVNDREDDLKAHMRNNYLGSRMVGDDCYITFHKPKSYQCTTCIQEAAMVLDNAKFWYLRVLYGFMMKAFDFSKIHVVELDTDSLYLAVAGNPLLGINQGFQTVVKDKAFYQKHRYIFLPNPSKGKADEKKLLGMAVEKEGNVMVALAPKCYFIQTVSKNRKRDIHGKEQEIEVIKPAFKNKGVDGKRNKPTAEQYMNSVDKNEITYAENATFRVNKGMLGKEVIKKVAITGYHTKMVVLKNHACAPFVFGIAAENYVCE